MFFHTVNIIILWLISNILRSIVFILPPKKSAFTRAKLYALLVDFEKYKMFVYLDKSRKSIVRIQSNKIKTPAICSIEKNYCVYVTDESGTVSMENILCKKMLNHPLKSLITEICGNSECSNSRKRASEVNRYIQDSI